MGQGRLQTAATHDGEELGVEDGRPVIGLAGLRDREEAVVEPHLDRDGVGGGDAVDGTLDLVALGVAPAGVRIVRAAGLGDLAGLRVLAEPSALDDVGVAQAWLDAGGEAEVLGRGAPAEVVLV